MSDTVQPKMRWILKAELGVFICIVCILVIKLVTADIDSTKAAVLKQAFTLRPKSFEVSDKARENSRNINKLHSVPFPKKEKINDNTAKSESETFGSVTGICYGSDNPSAVINNKTIVYEGDTIDGVTIAKIYRDKVEFTKDGKNGALPITRLP